MPRSLSRRYFALPASCWQLVSETRLPGTLPRSPSSGSEPGVAGSVSGTGRGRVAGVAFGVAVGVAVGVGVGVGVGSATGCTAAVGWASAWAAATSFVAVTTTLIMWPTSASVSVYVLVRSRRRCRRSSLPVQSQRCHW